MAEQPLHDVERDALLDEPRGARSDLPDGPELTAELRKLLEAKDCFVRASLDTATEE
ncbi:hypothetical protein GWI34_15625 [Actinomadura sp. DSM 109109]|nr:hypothetical protein [Actinomadura lepetitiana]